MEYYSTSITSYHIPDEVCRLVGMEEGKRQYRLVIKAKSRAAANRRFTEITGDTSKAFQPNYTSETGNDTEVDFCDKYGEIIGTGIGRKQYADLKVVQEEIVKYRNQTKN